MEFPLILTYNGESDFKMLQENIVTSIHSEQCEWRRGNGKSVKNVRLHIDFVPFSIEPLRKFKANEWSIIRNPCLHVFFLECNEIEEYKIKFKTEIGDWLKVLHSYGIQDWMILLVENIDTRKSKNILPRTTVLDRIRLDFASKNEDRCISLLNPSKFEQKFAESFRCLIQRLKHLILTSLNKIVVKYEELIRTNREKRNSPGWSFFNYFLLQEDLSFVLEKLEIYAEALVQYDELDAMFSQIIMNSALGESCEWLNDFQKPLELFSAINLNRDNEIFLRSKIIDNSITLLEFRNYLFERQCNLLQKCGMSNKIGERLLPFLFSTLLEIDILNIQAPVGALSCWEFVCSLEILEISDNLMRTENILCFQFTAPIWNLAKDNLQKLGALCGLLPGYSPTSDQLHTVVQLLAGIDDSSEDEIQKDLPLPSGNTLIKKNSVQKLKRALSSNIAFEKLYLELNELAISTYKHLVRLRFARLAGRDLGQFYCSLQEYNKATLFFSEFLRGLKTESWNYLSSLTMLQLTDCYQQTEEHILYIKACSNIACCLEMETLVRTLYFDKFLNSFKYLNDFSENEKKISVDTKHDCFKFIQYRTDKDTYLQYENISLDLKLESFFPRAIFADKIMLYFGMHPGGTNDCTNPLQGEPEMPVLLRLDYKQDSTLSCSSVSVDIIQKKKHGRRDNAIEKKKPAQNLELFNYVSAHSITICPGQNIIALKGKASRIGTWNLKQVIIVVQNIEFISDESEHSNAKMFDVINKPVSTVLSCKDLVAGIEQLVHLVVSGGSFIFPAETKIFLKCSKNLSIRLKTEDDTENPYSTQLTVYLNNFKSFEERKIPLEVLTDLPGKNMDKHIEHKISLMCPWSRCEIHIPMFFTPAITSSCRLHTCGTKKFLQVYLKGIEGNLMLTDASMNCEAKGISVINLNPVRRRDNVIYKNLTVSFLWELQVEPLKTEKELPIIKVHFFTKYINQQNPTIARTYACAFDVLDYNTLFEIQSHMEPSEICRVGSVCYLQLKIIKLKENSHLELMYEVLADQNMWAVCGRTAGIVSMKDVDIQTISLDVLPLASGFLPLPNVRLSKYIASSSAKNEIHPKLQPFPPGQIYNSTKSMQVQVLANSSTE